MRKTIFLLLVMAAHSLAFAQLKVNGSGDVGIKNNTNFDAMLNVGNSSNTYFFSDYGNHSLGIFSYNYESTSSNGSVGLLAEATKSGGTGRTVGVWGNGFGSTNKNFGVIGTIELNASGAAVYGTTEQNIYIGTGGYAGYFYGSTYVDGSLNTINGLNNVSDIRLGENITTLSLLSREQSPLAKLQNLEVIEYNLKRPSTKEVSDKRHYGVSAQDLQKLYPNLVQEGQDGYLTVNYVEMVPLLLRSIQELKQELDAVKGGTEHKTRSIGGETADFNAAATGNVLYQNTPNPFKEQTTIRFRLADDAVNAAICIFDMSGKMLKKLPVTQGMSSVTVNGYELGEGLYLYSLLVNGREIDTKRMILSK